MTSPITNTRPGHVASVLADVVHRRRTGSWPSDTRRRLSKLLQFSNGRAFIPSPT